MDGNKTQSGGDDNEARDVGVIPGETSQEQQAHTQYVERLQRAAEDPAYVDNDTLEQRVQSEIFEGMGLPKGPVTIAAADGVVTLRGQLDSVETMQAFEAAVRKVPGVRDVRNLLHPPSADAPNKRSAIEANKEAEETMESAGKPAPKGSEVTGDRG